uniref:HTH_Tnp_Tc3_1 domain-containing protein n=1 Tax=Heterorhabditis bacteriophora TaxID=37862 RepID=A0A1I7WH35_HETBA
MPLVDQCRERKVARGYLFNDIEKTEILTFSDAELNQTEITRKIGRSRNTIDNFLRAPGEYEIKKSGERPTKLGKRGKRRITVMASNSTANLNEIRRISCLTVSKTTVWRALKANPLITRERMRECPTLTADHKKAKMAFARTHMSWTSEWTEAILPFSIDEKKFDLDGPDGFTSCWRDLRKERRFPQKNFIFQQDNAVIHVSCGQKDWFRRRNIVLMDWPSRSPDLNPMKNLLGILARQVYAHNRQLSSIEDLKKTVSEEWSKSDPAILKNVSMSMTEGIFQVIRGGGSCIEY